MDNRSKSLNKASNMNNIGDNKKYKESMVIGDDSSKITDINKSMKIPWFFLIWKK